MPSLPKHVTDHLSHQDFRTVVDDVLRRVVSEYRYHEQRLVAASEKAPAQSKRGDATRALHAAVLAGAVTLLKDLVARRNGATVDIDPVLTRVIQAMTPPDAGAAPHGPPAGQAAPPPDRHPTEKE